MRQRVNRLRDQLNRAMSRQFEKELTDSVQRLRDAIAPYTRFVRVEREKLDQLNNSLHEVETELTNIRHTVKKLV